MMKCFVLFIILFVQIFLPQEAHALPDSFQVSIDSLNVTNDTLHQDKKEDQVIDEVIKSKTPAKAEAKYLSEVTKYGFKDLFKNYTYNAAMPYSSQVNPYAESYMSDYLKSHTRYLQNLQKTATPYFNLIDGILSQYGLPRELKYLAVIESNLKSTALSSAGARGPWQFMSYTAKDYGLQVNQWADDRTDYFKSTNAAARYLLTLYKDLKDWLLVIAAYNGGPGRVYSAIRKSGSRNFWELQYFLPEESRNHVKKFIATHYIMETKNPDGSKNDKFNYSSLTDEGKIIVSPKITADEKENLAESKISGRYKSKIIALNIEMDLKEFERYNPQFDNIISTGATFLLRLPSKKMDVFNEKKLTILDQCIQELLNGALKSSMDMKPVKSVGNKKK
ncbi:MAG: lytic transglycosylase domain-containing protein [Ginsengibacter sp.]